MYAANWVTAKVFVLAKPRRPTNAQSQGPQGWTTKGILGWTGIDRRLTVHGSQKSSKNRSGVCAGYWPVFIGRSVDRPGREKGGEDRGEPSAFLGAVPFRETGNCKRGWMVTHSDGSEREGAWLVPSET